MHFHSDSNRFKQCLSQCGEMFGRVVSKEQMAAYFTALEDLHIDCVAFGIKETMKHDVRFPPPAKIREFANMHKLKPSSQQVPYKTFNEFNGVTEFGTDSAKLMKAWANGDISHDKFLIQGIDLAEKHGKNELAAGLIEEFNRRNIHKLEGTEPPL